MQIANKEITLFPATSADAPLVVLHVFGHEGQNVYDAVKKFTDADFSFAVIGNVDWDADMSPWAISPISKNDTPCSGGADAYLKQFSSVILPYILKELPSRPKYLALAGYSLAGLFAIYVMYKTNLFARIASASGSFWYPDFKKFVIANKPFKVPEKIYFSLGDKEAKTHNAFLKSVEENTRFLKNHFSQAGIKTTFELNVGNHFQDTTNRMAKGIAWILKE